MTIEWPGDMVGDTQVFAQEAFREIREPDQNLLAVLLFWRGGRLMHVEVLDDSNFVDDSAKTELFERVVPGLIRQRTPDVVSLAMHMRSMPDSPAGPREDVVVTAVGADFVKMTSAPVYRRPHAPPVLGEWGDFPRSPDHEVRSWITDALRAALREVRPPSRRS